MTEETPDNPASSDPAVVGTPGQASAPQAPVGGPQEPLSEPEPEPEPPAANPGPSRALLPATIGVSVLLVASLVAAVWFGTVWIHNAFWVKPKADDRDQALIDARQAAINLNTVDSAHMDQTINDILSSSTGALADGFKQSRDQLIAVTKARGVTTQAKASDVVLTSFDHSSGSAKAMAFLVQTQKAPDQPQVETVRLGMELTMQRSGDVWKASDARLLFQGIDQNPGQAGQAPSGGQSAPAPAPAGGN